MSLKNKTIMHLLGEERLHQLVDRFYEHVSNHAELESLFPSDLQIRFENKSNF